MPAWEAALAPRYTAQVDLWRVCSPRPAQAGILDPRVRPKTKITKAMELELTACMGQRGNSCTDRVLVGALKGRKLIFTKLPTWITVCKTSRTSTGRWRQGKAFWPRSSPAPPLASAHTPPSHRPTPTPGGARSSPCKPGSVTWVTRDARGKAGQGGCAWSGVAPPLRCRPRRLHPASSLL